MICVSLGPQRLICHDAGLVFRGPAATPEHPNRTVVIVVRLDPLLSEVGVPNDHELVMICNPSRQWICFQWSFRSV